MSEPHTLLDAVYLYNGGKIDECGYTNLVTNIIKVLIISIIIIIIIIITIKMSSSQVHVAAARISSSQDTIDTVVIKPMFKCTPQIKIIKDRCVSYILVWS